MGNTVAHLRGLDDRRAMEKTRRSFGEMVSRGGGGISEQDRERKRDAQLVADINTTRAEYDRKEASKPEWERQFKAEKCRSCQRHHDASAKACSHHLCMQCCRKKEGKHGRCPIHSKGAAQVVTKCASCKNAAKKTCVTSMCKKCCMDTMQETGVECEGHMH